ncbi:DUF5309 domain-containing protein [Acidiphilium sp.]|uniref:DUF5309 domain-containing protein n=1 Tax=Acidiphilium sp. TaxID=527 RepID=UPI00258A443F|nr:DUF5309 domain-containing protein [Acidiphilium sp.]
MAVNAATTTRFDQQGVRESLTDKIYDLSPMDTPMMTAIGRGKAAKNTFEEWQTDELDVSEENAALEGDDANFATARPTVRLGNYTQIFTKAVVVSGTAQAVNTAGRRDELLYQVDKRTREMKRDMERAICQNRASQQGSRATARKLAGFEAWITTNANRGTGGLDGGWTTSTKIVAAATDASTTNRRTFTEARFKEAIRSCWDETGESPPLAIVGSFNKTVASGFDGIATQYQQQSGNPNSSKGIAILGAADWYVSDFGKHRIVPSHEVRARSALLLQPKHWEMRYLRPFKVVPLAKTGDADKKQLIAEATLVSFNEKSSGVVADLRES